MKQQSPERAQNFTKDQTSAYSIISHPKGPQNHTHPVSPQKLPFLQKGLDKGAPQSQISIPWIGKKIKPNTSKKQLQTEHAKVTTPQSVVQIFFRIPTKNTTQRAYQTGHLPRNLIRGVNLGEGPATHILTFQRIFSFHNEVKATTRRR